MGPINKEWLTPEELRAQAASAKASAERFRRGGMLSMWETLRAVATGKLRTAATLEAEAADLQEAADHLVEMRQGHTSTTLRPHAA